MQNKSEQFPSGFSGDDPYSIKVIYSEGKELSITGTFDLAVDEILKPLFYRNLEPLKLIFEDGKAMYFDRKLFEAYQHGSLHYSELIEQTECDELYRNVTELIAGKEIIESGALWKLNGNDLTLIDDDKHVTYMLTPNLFEIAT